MPTRCPKTPASSFATHGRRSKHCWTTSVRATRRVGQPAADTCIEALIATIAVLGDVSFGDIRNISFVGEGRGLCDPGVFDSPACSEHSSRSSRRSSRHSRSVDAEMGSASLVCSCEPQCEPAWSDTPHGSHGYACEVVYMWERDGRSITPAQREHCTAD